MSQSYEVNGIESAIESIGQRKGEAVAALRTARDEVEGVLGDLVASPVFRPVLLRTSGALMISFILVQLAKTFLA